MAKNLPGFTADLGYANAPAAPNPAVLEASYAAQGKAMEAAGAKRAEQIGALAKLAETGYTFSVEREAAARAQEVVDKLNEPKLGYVGALAQQASDLKDQAMSELQWQYESPVTEQLLADYNSKAREINAAAQQNMLSQQDAQARLASEMKKLIATHPAMAERIRKVFNSHTGRGDWDVRPVETALTAKAKEDEAQKTMMRLLEKDATKIFDSGVGKNFGMRNSAEIFQHLVNGTDTAVRMTTAVQANALVTETNKAMTIGNMNEYFINAFVASQAARVETTTRIAETLRQQGIDLSAPLPQLTEANRAAITQAYTQAKQAERNSIEAARTMLTDRLRANPSLDASVVSATMEKLTKQLESTPLTASLDDMISTLKGDATSRNVNAQTLFVAQQIRDLSLKTTWSQDVISKMQDPNTRKELLRLYPDNAAVKALAVAFDTRQANFADNLRTYEAIADGLFNPNASAAHRAAVVAAQGTDEGKRQIADIIQLGMGQGADSLKRGVVNTDAERKNIIILGENFVPSQQDSFSSLSNSITTGKWKEAFVKDSPEQQEFVRKTSGRISAWLNESDPRSVYSQVLDGANKLNANLVVQGGMINLSFPNNAVVDIRNDEYIKLTENVRMMNTLINMQNSLLERNDTASRTLLGTQTVEATTPTAIAVRPGEVVNTIRQGGAPREMRSATTPNPLATTGSAPAPLTAEQQRRQQAIANDLLPRTHDGYPALVNADGSVSTEISITVTDPRLNGGKPTNIPSLWKGKVVPEDEAVKNALASGNTYQSFPTIDAAVKAAKAKSAAGGANAPATTSTTTAATPWWRQ
jgi:hypothetical protein